jgi:hypothetical protein
MRKMILLAAMVAIAALMLAAAPAFAAHVPGHQEPPPCDRFENHPPPNPKHCIDNEGNVVIIDDFCEIFFCDFNNNNNNNNNNNAVPVFEITQDFEQEAESGDIDQSFDVSQTGDNSNQTVGIQGVANTGNAQNQIGVVDADGFGNFDGNNDFCDDFNNRNDFCEDFNRNDGFVICDLDNDGDNEECEDIDDGLVFCDRDGDGKDDGDDECFVIFPDFNDGGFFDDGDRFFGNGDNDGDIEFEDVGSTIELSPTNTVSSDQQVNQAAAAFGK